MTANNSDTHYYLKALVSQMQDNGQKFEAATKALADTNVLVGRMDERMQGHIQNRGIHHAAGDCSEIKQVERRFSKHEEEHPKIVKSNISLLIGGLVIATVGGGFGILKLIEFLSK